MFTKDLLFLVVRTPIYHKAKRERKDERRKRDILRRYAPLDVMVPSSYCFTRITSTKSLGAMMPMAADGVTVLQTVTFCVRGERLGR